MLFSTFLILSILNSLDGQLNGGPCDGKCGKLRLMNPLHLHLFKNQKSKMKCQEYGRMFAGDEDNEEFSHVAALGYDTHGEVSYKCVGSLISDRFVLTAAHCLSSNLGKIHHIRLGDLNGAGTHKDFEVLQGTSHPEYLPPSLYHDIALIELKSPVPLSPTIKPACLYNSDNTPRTITATGWGLTQFGSPISNNLQIVDLYPFSFEECHKIYGTSSRKLPQGVKNDEQICVAGEGDETCQGDFGGPLQIKGLNELYKIVGVTSFGKSCGGSHVPGVYTRVSRYIGWIESVVWP